MAHTVIQRWFQKVTDEHSEKHLKKSSQIPQAHDTAQEDLVIMNLIYVEGIGWKLWFHFRHDSKGAVKNGMVC